MNSYLILNGLRDYLIALMFVLIVFVGQQMGLASVVLTVVPNLAISDASSVLTWSLMVYFGPLFTAELISKAWSKLSPMAEATRIETAVVYALSAIIGISGFCVVIAGLPLHALSALVVWLCLPALLSGYVRALIIFAAMKHTPEPEVPQQSSPKYESIRDEGYWPKQIAAMAASVTFMSGLIAFVYIILVSTGARFSQNIDNSTLSAVLIGVAIMFLTAGASVASGKLILRKLGLFKTKPANHPGRAYFVGMMAISTPFCLVIGYFSAASSDAPAFIGFGLFIAYLLILFCVAAAGFVYGALLPRHADLDDDTAETFA